MSEKWGCHTICEQELVSELELDRLHNRCFVLSNFFGSDVHLNYYKAQTGCVKVFGVLYYWINE